MRPYKNQKWHFVLGAQRATQFQMILTVGIVKDCITLFSGGTAHAKQHLFKKFCLALAVKRFARGNRIGGSRTMLTIQILKHVLRIGAAAIDIAPKCEAPITIVTLAICCVVLLPALVRDNLFRRPTAYTGPGGDGGYWNGQRYIAGGVAWRNR